MKMDSVTARQINKQRRVERAEALHNDPVHQLQMKAKRIILSDLDWARQVHPNSAMGFAHSCYQLLGKFATIYLDDSIQDKNSAYINACTDIATKKNIDVKHYIHLLNQFKDIVNA